MSSNRTERWQSQSHLERSTKDEIFSEKLEVSTIAEESDKIRLMEWKYATFTVALIIEAKNSRPGRGAPIVPEHMNTNTQKFLKWKCTGGGDSQQGVSMIYPTTK